MSDDSIIWVAAEEARGAQSARSSFRELSRMRSLVIGVIATSLAASAAWPDTTQPYAGEEARDIASLSAQDIEDLLAGRGFGFALPAELNGYPGPAHVLELADELALTSAQRQRIEDIRAAMVARARALGLDYVAAEAALDAAFENGAMTPERLRELTGRASRIEAELRAVHLAAHLEVTPLLTSSQIAGYNHLRGYGGGDGASHSGHGNH